MTDPTRGGFAKQFILSGQAAGFDMMSEEGVRAYQEQHNQKMRDANAASIPLPGGMSAFMSDEMRSNLGNIENIDALPAQLQNLLGVLSAAMAEGKLPALGSHKADKIDEADEIDETDSSFLDFDRDLQNTMWQQAATTLPVLDPESIDLLTQQTISDTTPGTILRDFQCLLDAIGEKGTAVSNKQNTLPASLLAKLNQQLSDPIQINMQRPVQKSYPNINGLYMLLRATGIGQITGKGSKRFLVLDPTLFNSWKSLNPTEQYFSLLEAWLIRASQEILGDHRSPFNEGTKCVKYWSMQLEKGSKFKGYAEQQTLNYWPELHNLALLKLFGLLEVESGKPESGKGWRIKQVKPLPFGKALMQAVMQTFLAKDMLWEFEEDPTLPYGELQPTLQPYFPEWQNSLTVPAHTFRTGVHIFKVSLDPKIWRRIAISAERPLADLSDLILEAFEFDSDHLDMFLYKDYMGRTLEIKHPYTEEPPITTEVQIGDVPIAVGNNMTYVFDFGDWWEFEVQLEQVKSEDTRVDCEEILEAHGAAPPQYPIWDEDE